MTKYFLGVMALLIMAGCIGDDLVFDEVEPVIRILNPVDTIEIDSSYQFEFVYFNNVGVETTLATYQWESSASDIIKIESNGLATALQVGSAVITITGTTPEGKVITDETTANVGNSTVLSTSGRKGTLKTTSSYTLKGSFILEEVEEGVKLSFMDDYEASTALPELFVYLTNNPNSIDNAYEIGAVKIFKGAHAYELKDVMLNAYSHVLYYCKPFRVKVGDGKFED